MITSFDLRNRRNLLLLVMGVIAVACRHATSPSIVGAWTTAAPIRYVMIFRADGTCLVNTAVLSPAPGTYTLKGDNLSINVSVGSTSLGALNYKVTFDSADRMTLTPIPNAKAGGVSLQIIEALALHMTRVKNGEQVDAGAITDGTGNVRPADLQPTGDPDVDCITHVKQMTMALQMYAQDYDGVITTSAWQENLAPYVKSTEMFDCPRLVKDGQRNGYALNKDLPGMSTSRMADPSSTPSFFDSNVSGVDDIAPVTAVPSPPRHKDGNTIGYYDGHVKTIR